MNNRTLYRVARVLARTTALRRQKEKRLLWGLSTACFLLTIGLGGIFGTVTRELPLGAPQIGAFGAVLLWGGADAYVLTGVLAFTAGAVITTLCFKAQRKKKHNRKSAEKAENLKEK